MTTDSPEIDTSSRSHTKQSEMRNDPAKTSALAQMVRPQSITELRRFMGMVNQLGKFTPNLAEFKKEWILGPHQEESFYQIKAELTKPTVLAIYDPEASLKISSDASAYVRASSSSAAVQC